MDPQIIRSIRSKLDPSVSYYTFQLPTADTIIAILPFLLFAILVLTAFFATYISYQQILFVPDTNAEKPFSWSNTL
jgi:hypothetical protein